MYSRSRYPEEGVILPENYDGTAFADKGDEREECEGERDTACGVALKKESEKIPILSSLFGDLSIGLPKLGTEELLLIGAALFLLFSKDGDKECAIILLILLLIN